MLGSLKPCQLSSPYSRLELPTSLFSFTGIITPLSHWSPMRSFFSILQAVSKNLSHARFRNLGISFCSSIRLEGHHFHLRIFLGAKVPISQNVCFLLSVLIALLEWNFYSSILMISSWELLQY